MKRLFMVASVIGLAAISVAAAQGATTGHDVLAGLAERPRADGATTRMAVLAHSGPNGESAGGAFTVVIVLPNGGRQVLTARVTCLRVEGNEATTGGVVTYSTNPNAPVGSGYLIKVTDNGFPGAGKDTNINGAQASEGEIAECPLFEFPEVTLTKGDFAVHDG